MTVMNPAPPSFVDVFIGRQPILNPQNQVYGYELLFRNGYEQNYAEFESDDQATATVLHNALMGFNLDELVGQAKAFVNFPESFFKLRTPPFFDCNAIVCEVLETIEPTEEVIEGLQYLKKLGYQIALDDFVFKEKFIPFLRLADYIKVDISTVKPENLKLVFERIKKVTSARLLAERVETKDEFAICLEAGCVLFQGAYFAKPQIVSGKKLSVNQLNLLELLAKISDESASIDGLLSIVEKDMGLAHKLLKVATYYRTLGMPKFSSLKEAMMLFGLKRVQSWVSMIAMDTQSDVAAEVFNMARIRALFLRHAAQQDGLPRPESFYLSGLFSMLDVVLGCTLQEALAKLPLSDEMLDGMLYQRGEVGRLLKVVQSFEAKDDRKVSSHYRHLYLEAVRDVNAIAQMA